VQPEHSEQHWVWLCKVFGHLINSAVALLLAFKSLCDKILKANSSAAAELTGCPATMHSHTVFCGRSPGRVVS